jgi:hypothetical protein
MKTITGSKKTGFGIILFLISLSAVHPFTLEIRARGGTRPINENYPFPSSEPLQVQRTVTIRHRGAAVDFFFTAGPGLYSGGNYSERKARSAENAFLSYEVTDADGNDLTQTSGISGSFPARPGGGWSNVEVNFVVSLTPDQFPRKGEYTDEIELRLYASSTASGTPHATEVIELTVTMAEVIDMQITHPGGVYGSGVQDYEIEFDPVLPGMTRQADLLVRANTVFSVEIESFRGGVLTIPDDTSTIAYRFVFDGKTTSLPAASPVPATTGESPTSWGGRSFPMVVEIQEYGLLPTAGTYTDTLNITILGQ